MTSKSPALLRTAMSRTPTEIIEAHEQELRRLLRWHDSAPARFLRWRRSVVTREGIGGDKAVAALVGWTVYLLVQAGLLLAVTQGWMTAHAAAETALAVAGAGAFAAAVAGAYAVAGALAVVHAFAYAAAGAGVGVVAVPVAAAVAIAAKDVSMERSIPLLTALLRLLVALVATPVHLLFRAVDLCALRHPEHPLLTEATESSPTDERTAVVVAEYRRKLAVIRGDLLGSESNLEKNRAFFAERLKGIRERKERVALRLKAVPDAQSERREPLSELLGRIAAREARHEEELRRLEQDLIPRVTAYLAELDRETASFGAYLGDEELIRAESEDAEEDDALIAEARARTEAAVDLHGKRVYMLLSALTDVSTVRTLGTSDAEMLESFRRQDEFAERLAELEHLASTDGNTSIVRVTR